MELTKRYIHMNREKGRASSQITLDDDFNVPDLKPDVMRLIQDRGEIKIEEVAVIPGHIRLAGVLRFQLLYRSDGEERRVSSLSGEIPFQESLAMDGLTEYDTARVRWQIEDLSVGVINSRKLSVKALVMLTAGVNEIYDEEAASVRENAADVQVLECTRAMLQLFFAKKDTFRFKEEIMLPSNKPNIREVLWKSVQLRGVETRLVEDGILIKGEALVFVLYLGEEEEERLQWLESALPFSGTLPCSGSNEDMTLDITYDIAAMELEPRPDYDGEERMLHLELVLELDIRVYQEEQVSFLEDVYAVNCRLLPEYESAVFEQLLIKNASKCRVSDRISIGENQEGILQLCASEGSVSVDHVEPTEEGLAVSGTLSVQILYVTADDRNPLASLKDVIPFQYLIEVPGITPESRYQLEACLEQLTTIMLDASQVEIKAVIALNSIVFERNPLRRIVSVREEPLDMEALQERPGIVGYIARSGDRLWDIAKENYTTIAGIQETNHLTEDVMKGGEKILIIKTVG